MVLSYRLEPGFYEKSDRLVKSIRDKPEWPIQVPETPSAFIRTRNVTPFLVMVRVNNPDRSPLRIDG
jgi:hypothetical protein